MRGHLALLIYAACAAGSTGCASTSLSVEPVTGDSAQVQGVRYSLPKPFLVVKPSPTGDGTFTVEVVSLPNEDQTYAISARTRRGKYSLDVETQEGLLKKISWSAEGGSEVDAALSKSATELAKAAVDKREADQKTAEGEAEAEVKAQRTEVKAAQEVAEAKKLAVKLAEIELKSTRSAIVNPNNPTAAEKEAVRQAELKRDKAVEEQADADLRLQRRQAALAAALNAGAKNDATSRAGGSVIQQFWGPVIYEIRDTGTSVDLIPVQWTQQAAKKQQIKLETATTKAPVERDDTSSSQNILSFKDVNRTANGVVVRFDAASGVKTIDVNQVTLLSTSTGAMPAVVPAVGIEGDGRLIVLTFATLPKDDYIIVIRGTNADGTNLVTSSMPIKVP